MILDYTKIGDVKAYSSCEVSRSRVGVGFEKLDRAVFDPEKAYDHVAALGVKWVRLQSGWQRTETEKGVYHFEWLDDIVDNLRRRSVEPWVCLCYGNRLYDQQAAERFGGVGCPPNSPEELPVWLAYVRETVRHFAGRVTWWEIWNEPDCSYSWRYHVNMVEYGIFARETAKAIREAAPEAKIILGAFAGSDMLRVRECFEQDVCGYVDAVSFHIYSGNVMADDVRISNLRRLMNQYSPKLELIQGEGGCQSRHDGAGALAGQYWTPEKQAKSLARHMLQQLSYDCKFASYFSCMDMIEALNGKVGDKASYMDFGYFGVVGADFDENGIASGNYTRKPSFRSLQTIASLLREDFEVVTDIPWRYESVANPRFGGGYAGAQSECRIFQAFFRKPNGSVGMALWAQTNILRQTYEGSISVRLANVPTDQIRLVDVVDGSVYELKADNIIHDEPSGTLLLRHVPLFDRPVMLCFGDFM